MGQTGRQWRQRVNQPLTICLSVPRLVSFMLYFINTPMNNQGTKCNPIESFAPRLCAFYSGKMYLFPVFDQICTITMNDIITQLITKPIVDILMHTLYVTVKF